MNSEPQAEPDDMSESDFMAHGPEKLVSLAAVLALIDQQPAELAVERADDDADFASKAALLEYGLMKGLEQSWGRDAVREAHLNTERQDSQHVLKAEAARPDATDREEPATASPGVGPMGAGQPADAGSAGRDAVREALTDEQRAEIDEAMPKVGEKESVWVMVRGNTLRALAAMPSRDTAREALTDADIDELCERYSMGEEYPATTFAFAREIERRALAAMAPPAPSVNVTVKP